MNQDRSGQSGDSTAMDAAALYIEEVFTDQRVGTIRRLTPVTADGDKDPQRKVLFQGQAQILTPNGALPINFELPADSLADAVAQFGDAAKMALEDTMRELQEMRREAASSIVIPDTGSIPKDRGPGGKIQLR